MKHTDDFQTRIDAHTPQYVPPEKRPGHEQDHGDDPAIGTRIENKDGHEWFSIGNSTGIVCTRDPVDVER